MDIHDTLHEVLQQRYGGKSRAMARNFGIGDKPELLYYWLNRRSIPSAKYYTLLSEGLGRSIDEVHRLCEEARRRRTRQAESEMARDRDAAGGQSFDDALVLVTMAG